MDPPGKEEGGDEKGQNGVSPSTPIIYYSKGIASFN